MGPRPSRLAAASPPPPPVVPPPPPPPPAQAERERARTPAAAAGSRYLRVFIQVLLAEYRLDRWCSWCGDHHTSDPTVGNASVYIKALPDGNRIGGWHPAPEAPARRGGVRAGACVPGGANVSKKHGRP